MIEGRSPTCWAQCHSQKFLLARKTRQRQSVSECLLSKRRLFCFCMSLNPNPQIGLLSQRGNWANGIMTSKGKKDDHRLFDSAHLTVSSISWISHNAPYIEDLMKLSKRLNAKRGLAWQQDKIYTWHAYATCIGICCGVTGKCMLKPGVSGCRTRWDHLQVVGFQPDVNAWV